VEHLWPIRRFNVKGDRLELHNDYWAHSWTLRFKGVSLPPSAVRPTDSPVAPIRAR
jgi:hypothetical protein